MRRIPSSLLQFDILDRGASVFAIGMLIGAVWYFSIPFEPSIAVLVLIWVAAGIGFVWIRRTEVAGALALSLLAFAAATGALSGKLATERLNHVAVAAPMGPVLVEGWITQAEPAARGVRLVIKTHAVDGVLEGQRPKLIRLTHISSLQTEPGRFVRCWAVLRPPPAPIIAGDYAFDRQAWYAGLGAVGYIQGRCRGGALGPPGGIWGQVALKVSEVRRSVARHVHEAAGERAGGFAAALASGDRSFMFPEDQDALRGAGLAHLLAISGLHMGIVGGLVFFGVWRGLALIEPIALRWTVKKPAAAAALVACTAYLVISGASVATQRAFVMAVVLFGAVLVDRVALTQRSLAIAMILIILIAPWSVLTPGFQMSFAATAALIATYEAWQARRKASVGAGRSGVAFWVKSLGVTSLVSSLATMPFALFHFNRVAGLGILANLAAMPIISLVTAPLAAMALVAAPIGLDAPVLRLFGLSLEAVLAIAHWTSSLSLGPDLSWPRMPPSALVSLTAALIWLCLRRSGQRQAWRLAGFLALSGVMWALSARDRIHWAPSGDVFLESASGRVSRIAFVEGDGLGPLQFSDVPVSEHCAPGSAACQQKIGAVAIALVHDADPTSCFDLESSIVLLGPGAEPVCGSTAQVQTVSWRDVIAENGVTYARYGNRLHKREKPPCGRRAWRPCPPITRTSE
ncbi:MAG: ComEC/Rec2 family competence protein [Pseudomonadota bacterium]